jgi:hypothetical protein
LSFSCKVVRFQQTQFLIMNVWLTYDIKGQNETFGRGGV